MTDQVVDERPFISVAILAYNEEATIEAAIERTLEVLNRCGRSFELLLIDDGSTDGTTERVRALLRTLPNTRLIAHEKNLGIPAGIRSVYFESRGSWAVWLPGDLQAPPEDLLVQLPRLDHCDVLLTYRDHKKRTVSSRRILISAIDRFLTGIVFGLWSKDQHWIRFFHRDVLDRMDLRSRSMMIDTEMAVAAKKMGAKIEQAPYREEPRAAGKASGSSLSNVIHAFCELFLMRIRGVRIRP